MQLRIRLAAVAVRLDAGELALRLLDSLDAHVDGCGTEPDRDDWIVDCASQSGFRELLSLFKRGVSTLVLPDGR